MKLFILGAFIIGVAAMPASSAIVTLGLSTQNFGLAGIGGNSQGEGQSTVTWGNCGFDGVNTTCTLSGPMTGFGPGTGTYALVLQYAGNGAFPLGAVSQSAGSDLFTFYYLSGNPKFTMTLTPSSGPAVSFYSFANFQIFFSGAKCTGLTSNNCGVGQVGLNPGSTIIGPVTGSFDPTPYINSPSVISASGYGAFPAVAPSSWIEIYGVNLAVNLPDPPRSQTWSGKDFNGSNAPTSLSGTTVTVAGQKAYTYYVSPGQLNVQVPDTVPVGPQPVVVTTMGGTSAAYTVQVNATEPGLLAPPQFVINGKQYVVALFSNTLTYVLPGNIQGVQTARARAGDKLTLYGIGFGTVTPSIPAGQLVSQQNSLNGSLAITFGGVPAQITYAGLVPTNIGLYQFNVVVPSVPAGDTVPVAFTLNGQPSTQNLVIAIQ